MKKVISCILVLTFLFCIHVSAEEASYKWSEIYSVDFEGGDPFGGDFFDNLNLYDLKESNLGVSDGNTYYVGEWMNGSNIYYVNSLKDYYFSFDIRTESAIEPQKQNAYKAGFQIAIPIDAVSMSTEPDNTDDDKSSYIGCGGIAFYLYDSTIEVVIRTNKDGGTAGPVNGVGKTSIVSDSSNRVLGMYGVGYQFTIPDGVSFNNFTHLKVEYSDSKVSLYIGDEIFMYTELSNIGKTTVTCNSSWGVYKEGDNIIDEEVYRTATVKNAAGEVMLTVDEAVVPLEGTLAFMNRGAKFNLDNLAIFERVKASTPAPTSEVTPTDKPTDEPEQTKSTETAVPTTEPKADPEKSNSSIALIVILACAIVGIGVTIVIIKKKKK